MCRDEDGGPAHKQDGEMLLRKVEHELGHVRARLRGHRGDVEIRDVDDDGAVTLEFVGACRGCPAKAFTYAAVVRPALEATPGVTTVKAPQVKAAAAVLERIRRANSGGLLPRPGEVSRAQGQPG